MLYSVTWSILSFWGAVPRPKRDTKSYGGLGPLSRRMKTAKTSKVAPASSPFTVKSLRAGEFFDAVRRASPVVKLKPQFRDVEVVDVLSPTNSELGGNDRFLTDLFAMNFDDNGEPILPKPKQPVRSSSGETKSPLGFGAAYTQAEPDSPDDGVGVVPANPGDHPLELAAKLSQLIDKLAAYKRKCDALKKRNVDAHSVIKKMESEISQLQDELEIQQAQNDGNIMARLGIDQAKNKNQGGASEALERKRREEAKKQLFRGIDMLGEVEGEAVLDDVEGLPRYKRALMHVQQVINRHLPLQNDLKSIDACYGPTVNAYFMFSRWILLNFLILCAISLAFLLKHITRGSFGWATFVQYYMPDLFVPSSYQSTEAGDYAFNTIFVNVVLLGLGLRKWIKEDMRVKAQTAFERQSGKFSKLALCIWDHGVKSGGEAEELKLANGQQINVLLLEEETAELTSKRSMHDKLVLWARRATGIMLSITLQAVAGYGIVQLTFTSSNLQESITQGSIAFLAPIASSIVPAAVSLMNAIQPPLLKLIAAFEKWDESGSHIKWMVWRLFISKVLNVMIQVFTFALLADPYLLNGKTYGFDTTFLDTVRASATPLFQQSQFDCRADQTSTSLMRLVLTEFVVGRIILIAVPVAMGLLSRIQKQPVKKDELDLPNKMAGLLYFVSLCLATLVWSPLSVFFVAPILYLYFKYDKFVLFRYLQKPLKPWSARDAGIFFVKFYLITQAIGVASSVVMMSTQTYPKTCSVMDGVVSSLYSGVDPYCTDLAEAQALVNANPSWSTQKRLSVLGPEAAYWFRTQCYDQCMTGDLSSSECENRCNNAVNVTLACGNTNVTFDSNGYLVAANVTKPCDLACGAFVDVTNGWQATETALRNTSSVLSGTYKALQEPALLFTASMGLLIFACMKWNSLSVIQELAYQREAVLKQTNEQLARKLRIQGKRLALLQGVAADD